MCRNWWKWKFSNPSSLFATDRQAMLSVLGSSRHPSLSLIHIFNALASYQLLIIDDLGVERNSEYALGIIFSVIDRRIRSGRPLIITTNFPLNEIKSETVLDKKRIYDRI